MATQKKRPPEKLLFGGLVVTIRSRHATVPHKTSRTRRSRSRRLKRPLAPARRSAAVCGGLGSRAKKEPKKAYRDFQAIRRKGVVQGQSRQALMSWRWWMWCCGSCGSGCVSNKSIVSILTSNQQFHKKTRLTAQQPPLISHTTTRRWLRVHDSSSRTRGCTPTMYATTPAVAEKRSCSSAPAPAAQRARDHQGLDKQLPARSEAGHK